MRLTILTLITLLLIALFLRLGFWQLARHNEKKTILATQISQEKASPFTYLPETRTDLNAINYHPIRLKGKFLPINFLLDNRHHQHQIGYEVLTPLKIDKTAELVLVNRGWISREKMKYLRNVEEKITLKGILYFSFTEQIVFQNTPLELKPNTIVIQKIDIAQLSQLLKQPLYPMIILMDPNPNEGFVREWKFTNSAPEKNLGYALQWFSFAFVLACIYFILLFRGLFKRKKFNAK